MEKLIELLNEYEIKRMKTKMDITDKRTEGDLDNEYTPLIIISKKFGFIKWLVEKDKIDFYTILKENGTFRKEFYSIENKKEYERLIMLLSVEDEPINFLISILK